MRKSKCLSTAPFESDIFWAPLRVRCEELEKSQKILESFADHFIFASANDFMNF